MFFFHPQRRQGPSLLHLLSYLYQTAEGWIQAYLPFAEPQGRAIAQAWTVQKIPCIDLLLTFLDTVLPVELLGNS